MTKFADDTPLKQTARKMILMVNALNKNNFGGVRMVTCYSCHRGDEVPRVRPCLSEQYGVPLRRIPMKSKFPRKLPGGFGGSDFRQIPPGARRDAAGVQLDELCRQRDLRRLRHGKGKSPCRSICPSSRSARDVRSYTGWGQNEVYDGRAGWIAEPDTPAPLMALTGGDLDGAKIEAMLFFPSQVKQIRSQWRTGMASVDGHRTEVVEGTGAGQLPLKLYFDQDSGLLVRMVHFTNTLVGQITTQVDYSDYRTVSGLKVPFQWTETWVDGQSTTQLTDVQVNAPIGPDKFGKPQAPAN